MSRTKGNMPAMRPLAHISKAPPRAVSQNAATRHRPPARATESMRNNLASAEGGDGVSAKSDKARFASVVLTHIDDAYVLARWMTGDSDGAHNVVQDACMRAYSAIDEF